MSLMSASGANNGPSYSFETRKDCKMVRVAKSKSEMKKAATYQAIRSTINAGMNGCWIVYPPVPTFASHNAMVM